MKYVITPLATKNGEAERVDPKAAEYFGVYLRDDDRHHEWINDFKTESEAMEFIKKF